MSETMEPEFILPDSLMEMVVPETKLPDSYCSQSEPLNLNSWSSNVRWIMDVYWSLSYLRDNLFLTYSISHEVDSEISNVVVPDTPEIEIICEMLRLLIPPNRYTLIHKLILCET